MRITKVNISNEHQVNGLDDIKMDRLGQVVLLTGKNGSGKTRILGKIFSTLPSKHKKSVIDDANKQIQAIKEKFINYKKTIETLQIQLLNTPDKQYINENIKVQNNLIEQTKKNIVYYENIFNWNMIETSELSENYMSIPFVPKGLILKDSSSYSKNDLKAHAKSVDSIGLNSLPQGAYAKIQNIQDRWFNATHQNSTLPKAVKDKSIKDYLRLVDIIKLFLNVTIERTEEGDATIFGFLLGDAKLSNGQIVLLQFCIAIYSQETALKDLILVLDEPENHLHPSVIIETIDRIIECVPNGQVWIATHSIPLLAHFDPKNIWYVENGKVSYAGKIPEKVLEGLLGDEKEIAKLQEFIGLPAQFAINRFAYECLLEPKSVNTDKDDKQSLQIKDEIKKHLKDNKKIKILDYGAGKCRLLANIFESSSESKEDFIKWFDYVAYDKFDKNKEECEKLISDIYDDSNKRYYNDVRTIQSDYFTDKFDIIIMCNVLHEIDPKKWLELFKKDGDIYKLLNENGILLIVEDLILPTGEKAYNNGFVILDDLDIKELFYSKATNIKSDRCEVNDRLIIHTIPKECLEALTSETRKKALESVKEKAKKEIKALRDKTDYKSGRLHGFYVQQFANATLSLDEL